MFGCGIIVNSQTDIISCKTCPQHLYKMKTSQLQQQQQQQQPRLLRETLLQAESHTFVAKIQSSIDFTSSPWSICDSLDAIHVTEYCKLQMSLMLHGLPYGEIFQTSTFKIKARVS